jgi:hemerythrin-like domain-containing protein
MIEIIFRGRTTDIMPPMKLTEALLGEHGVLYDLLDEIEELAASAETAGELAAGLAAPGAALIHHATIEDELLFPALESVIGRDGMAAVMRAEHQDIGSLVERARSGRDLASCRRLVEELLATTRAHFAKEENVLFPAAEAHVGAEQLEDLGRRWAKMRSVHVGESR